MWATTSLNPYPMSNPLDIPFFCPSLSFLVTLISDSTGECFLLKRVHVIRFGPIQIFQGNLPILRSKYITLITLAKSSLPYNITYLQVSGIRVWTSLGIYSTFHTCSVSEYEAVFRSNLTDWKRGCIPRRNDCAVLWQMNMVMISPIHSQR